MRATDALLAPSFMDVSGYHDGGLIFLYQGPHPGAAHVRARRHPVDHLTPRRGMHHQNDLLEGCGRFQHIADPLADLLLAGLGRGLEGGGGGEPHRGQAHALAQVHDPAMHVASFFGQGQIHGPGIHVANLGKNTGVEPLDDSQDAFSPFPAPDIGQIPGKEHPAGLIEILNGGHGLDPLVNIPESYPEPVSHLPPALNSITCRRRFHGKGASTVMQERSKSALRTAFRQLRQHLDPGQAATDSSMVRERLLNLDRFRQARSVLLYLPTSGEVDTWPLLDHFWKMGNQVLLPRCRPHEPGIMDAYAVTSRHDLAQGSFGLTEPRPDLARLIPQPDPEVVLIPALAFDRRGYRLGFGGATTTAFCPPCPP